MKTGERKNDERKNDEIIKHLEGFIETKFQSQQDVFLQGLYYLCYNTV